MADRTRPSLAGARLRVRRGAQHANAIVRLVKEHTVDSGLIYIRVDAAQHARQDEQAAQLDWSEWRHPSSSELSLLASESLFNLRAALDYLAYELAWLDAKEPQEHTQFPIVDRPDDWPSQALGRLPRVSESHRRAIREYQPFEGCDWTSTLRDLSNFDKRRLLVRAEPVLAFGFNLSSLDFTQDPDDPLKLRAPVANPQADVLFPSNVRVIETLQTIAVAVGRVIERFGPEFGENAKLRLTHR